MSEDVDFGVGDCFEESRGCGCGILSESGVWACYDDVELSQEFIVVVE